MLQSMTDNALTPLLSDEKDWSDESTTDNEELTEFDRPSDIKDGEFA